MNPISSIQSSPISSQAASDVQQPDSGELSPQVIKTAQQIYGAIFMQMLKLIQSAASEG